MTEVYLAAVHRTLLTLAHELGMLLAHETGGTAAAATELAADYLIETFHAEGDTSVPLRMLEALEARKAAAL